MSSSSLSEDVSLKSAALESGREGLEYSTEADMTMVSLAPESFLPSLLGSNSHHQLRDCFALSSINPNYAYMVCVDPSSPSPMLRCVDLRTGEFRSVGRLWGLTWSVHCVTTGFGYVAVVTPYEIYLADESNWRHFWKRTRSFAGMLNSCVLTKLLAGEDELGNASPEEVVLLVASNGGAIYTIPIPKPTEQEYMLIDLTPSDAEDSVFFSDVDQTGVPEGKRRVLKYTPNPDLELKQTLRRTGPSLEFNNIQNINCLVQGKGMYTDYLIGAPDYEKRLLIFIRQYGNKKVTFVEPHHYNELGHSSENDDTSAQYSIFELIEQQRNKNSLILPIKTNLPSETAPVAKSEESHSDSYSDDDSIGSAEDWRGWNAPGGHTVNSLNLAWAPWHHRSILAAGTDSDDLIIYDFDEAHRLMCEQEPNFVFDANHSASTIVFQKRFKEPVRLLKFSPLPSVPILAVADMTKRVTFINCNDFNSIEYVKIPGLVTGMSWSLDASVLYVATNNGCVKIKVKMIPSLTDQVLLSIVQSKLCTSTPSKQDTDDSVPTSSSVNNVAMDVCGDNAVVAAELEALDGGADLKERLDLLEFGWLLAPRVPGVAPTNISWLDEEYVNPPERLKTAGAEGGGVNNKFTSNTYFGRRWLGVGDDGDGNDYHDDFSNSESSEISDTEITDVMLERMLEKADNPLGDDPAEEDDD